MQGGHPLTFLLLIFLSFADAFAHKAFLDSFRVSAHRIRNMPATRPKSGSNWNKLKQKIDVNSNDDNGSTNNKKKRKRTDIGDILKSKTAAQERVETADKIDEWPVSDREKEKYLGLDCEMVGVGSNAKKSVLARCCLVDFDGEKVYDEYVRPKSFVTDFRTKYSGVRKSDLRKGKAVTLEECMHDVSQLLQGKVLVGHALHNDLDVLMLNHHRSMIRDTATYAPYMRPHGRDGGKMRPRALRDLSKEFLGLTIQEGEHDPGIDAKVAMMLYRRQRKTWEDHLRQVTKEKRDKSLQKREQRNDSTESSRPSSSKKKKTKSSMFDNCS